MIREKVKRLWKLCFDDSDEFIDMYFRLCYNNDVNIAIQSGEEIIAALQMLPYPMTFGKHEINTAYISGACTHPDYRNKGVMRELLSQAFTRMSHKKVTLSTLIPAEPWLFDYYAHTGYAPVFYYDQSLFKLTGNSFSNDTAVLKRTNEFRKDIYEYFNRKLKERICCVQHTEADFHIILSDLRISRGYIYILKQSGNIIALAVTYPSDDGSWYIGEIVADNSSAHSLLLQSICEQLNIPSIRVLTPPVNGQDNQPMGMARIINAQAILQLYAANHPEVELNIALTDEQIRTNNGYYYLNNGKCMSSAKRLPGSHLALTIGELTEMIFSPLHPYMSLMLN